MRQLLLLVLGSAHELVMLQQQVAIGAPNYAFEVSFGDYYTDLYNMCVSCPAGATAAHTCTRATGETNAADAKPAVLANAALINLLAFTNAGPADDTEAKSCVDTFNGLLDAAKTHFDYFAVTIPKIGTTPEIVCKTACGGTALAKCTDGTITCTGIKALNPATTTSSCGKCMTLLASKTKQGLIDEYGLAMEAASNTASDAAAKAIKDAADAANDLGMNAGKISTDGLEQANLEKMLHSGSGGLVSEIEFKNISDAGYGAVVDAYLDPKKSSDVDAARAKVGDTVNKSYMDYNNKYNSQAKYDEKKNAAQSRGQGDSVSIGTDMETALAGAGTVAATGEIAGVTPDPNTQNIYKEKDTKKGDSFKENLKQVLETSTQENENETTTFVDNSQEDKRKNITGRYETPRLFTNRTGYVKSSWKATDKFAAWEVVGAVDALLQSATNIDADTGSVGRVGQSSDAPSYSAPQINYRGVVKDASTGGY